MQKFTRPITREIELDGERLALTFTEKGINVRTVGSRRPPVEASWTAIVCQAATQGIAEPAPEAKSRAMEVLGAGRKPGAKPAGTGETAPETSTGTQSAPPPSPAPEAPEPDEAGAPSRGLPPDEGAGGRSQQEHIM